MKRSRKDQGNGDGNSSSLVDHKLPEQLNGNLKDSEPGAIAMDDMNCDQDSAVGKEDMALDDSSSGTLSAAERGRLFYEQRVSELKAEREKVEDGTHETLVAQGASFEEERDKRLNNAMLYRDFSIKEIDALYDYECKNANQTYSSAIDGVKAKLTTEINETIKRMEALRDGINDNFADNGVRTSKRVLRSKRNEAGDDGVDGYSGVENTNANNANQDDHSRNSALAGYGPESLSGLTFFMKEAAVADDLKLIQQDWRARAESFLSKEAVRNETVKVVDGVLYYNELIFEKDTDLVVTTEVTKEEIYGKIQTVNATDIVVKLLDGTITRILINHLRTGRCKIAPVEED